MWLAYRTRKEENSILDHYLTILESERGVRRQFPKLVAERLTVDGLMIGQVICQLLKY